MSCFASIAHPVRIATFAFATFAIDFAACGEGSAAGGGSAVIRLAEERAGSLRRALDVATGAGANGGALVTSALADDSVFWDGFEFCGNGIVDPGEQCDRNDLNGASCLTFGFTGGTLGCTQQCQVDTALCL